MRLLVVEDEKHLNKTLTERLTKIGYTVDNCFDGEDALYYIENTQYDGVILDVMMPKINGFEVLRIMRDRKILTPVLMLTAKDSDEDIITGLDTGANDYLPKPFSFAVLCARIRAMLRVKENISGNILEIADLSVDTVTRTVKRGDDIIELSSKEYSVLEYLMRNKGIIVSKEKIEENIWNYEYEGTSDVIKVYIHHLRKKIDDKYEKKLLHTIKNVGYVIRED
ncbi:MAG: response regulator transcription factor [Ruminococcaceae bacterium]|nr:response regulator transcription factor [Oscillospiraceae bacterium]